MKRDTISDISDSIKNGLGLSDNAIIQELEDINVRNIVIDDLSY